MTRPAEQELHTTVVGGGPAGLFYASLAKQRFPQHEIVVCERSAPDATFGFGVVFSERTVGGIAAADPELHASLAAHGVSWTDIELRHGGETIRCGGNGFAAISRKTLLRLMQERAAEVGATLRFESPLLPGQEGEHDLLVGADGVNSRLREQHPETFEPSWESGQARYIWFATPQPFDALTMIFVENELGQWGGHAYPFEDGTSTFIVETDEETWRRAGLDAPRDLAPGETDMASQVLCEEIFAEHLGGAGLIGNNSRWLTFRTLRCERWQDGKMALLGDAVHTAHFSVGSGTKMAMEDAVSLVDCVGAAASVPAALAAYEASRRPGVEHIQAAAAPSLFWWERFRHLHDLPIERFGVHFLSRSPVVTLDRIRSRDRRFVAGAERWAADTLGAGAEAGPLAAALEIGDLRLPSRLVMAPSAAPDPLVALGGAALAGAGLVIGRGAGEWSPVVEWLHEHTATKAGFALGADFAASDVGNAAGAGFDALVCPADAEGIGDWPHERALLATVLAPTDPDSPTADACLDALAKLAVEWPLLARVTAAAGGGLAALAEQQMLCDRIHQELGLATLLVDPPGRDEAATAIVAGRAELVEGLPSLVSERWPGR